MKALVRFLLIFTCMKLIVSKPQHLQQQPQYHLDPLNEPQFEYPPKDPGKRTIGSGRHYALGKHVGIHPHGFKYVLGYSPINIKYVPVVKPVTVLKPVLHQSIKSLWKPVLPPTRQYLPPALSIPKPIHQIDHGWKPVAPPLHLHKPWQEEVPHIHPVVEHPVEVQQLLPAVPAPLPPVQQIVKPAVPALHNYYYFQTPISKPALLPQLPLFHVARPQLPVLPLGASFPAPVLQSTGPAVVPSGPAAFPFPIHPQLAHPLVPVHHQLPVHHPVPIPPPVHHPVAVQPQPVYPVHRPVVVQPQPAPALVPGHIHPSPPVHFHPQPAPSPPVHFHPQPAPSPPVHVHPQPLPPIHVQPQPPVHVHPQPGAPSLVSVEFHGNRHLVPFNNQFPFTSIQSSVPLPKIPDQIPQVMVGRQPHALPLPPEVHTQLIPEVQHSPGHFLPQAPFNPDAAIQPGQTDLQVPLHLPDHPHFRVNHFQPAGSLEPPFPSFQNPGNILRPSISLEPPLTHGHS